MKSVPGWSLDAADMKRLYSIGWHAHREGVMFTVLHGLTTMRTDTGTWTMLPRQFGWLPPTTRHCGHSFGKAERVSLRADFTETRRPRSSRVRPRDPAPMRLRA